MKKKGFKYHEKYTLMIVEVILYFIILVIMKDIRPWHPRVINYNMADPDKGGILSFCNFNPLVGWNTMQLHWKSYLANVVLLLPAGFLTGYFVRNRTAYWVLGVGGCVVLELLQLVTQVGVFDILTVIFEVLGYAVGYRMLCMVKRYEFSGNRR